MKCACLLLVLLGSMSCYCQPTYEQLLRENEQITKQIEELLQYKQEYTYSILNNRKEVDELRAKLEKLIIEYKILQEKNNRLEYLLKEINTNLNIEQKSLNYIVSLNNALILRGYMSRFGESEQAKSALKELEESKWGRAKTENTQSSYEEYLYQFPNGLYIEEAKKQISNLYTEISCPFCFPWPPPKASAKKVISSLRFEGATNLGDIDKRLTNVLESCGYSERSYYTIINPFSENINDEIGFALVARIEQTDKEAFSLQPPERWAIDANTGLKFSITRFLESLWFKDPGFYRVIVFIVTDKPFKTSDKKFNFESGKSLVDNGLNKLPKNLARIEFDYSFDVTALIYEFIAPESGEVPYLASPSDHDINIHLERSKITEALFKK